MESLARVPNPHLKGKQDKNFVISKAVNMDNLPEKAQANQRKKILNKAIDDRYVADNYY